jgi:hypothetical protein
VSERQSVRWTIRNLRRLLEARLKQRFDKDSGVSESLGKEDAEG